MRHEASDPAPAMFAGDYSINNISECRDPPSG